MEMFFLKKKVNDLNNKLQQKNNQITLIQNESLDKLYLYQKQSKKLEKNLIPLKLLKQVSMLKDKEIKKYFKGVK